MPDRQAIIAKIRDAVQEARDLPDAEFEVTMREASAIITHAYGSRNDNNAEWKPEQTRR